MRHHQGNGTYLDSTDSGFVAGRALCPDGKIRQLKRISISADTFFSIPASVTVRGKTVAGFVSTNTLNDSTSVVKFTPYKYRKNANAFYQTSE